MKLRSAPVVALAGTILILGGVGVGARTVSSATSLAGPDSCDPPASADSGTYIEYTFRCGVSKPPTPPTPPAPPPVTVTVTETVTPAPTPTAPLKIVGMSAAQADWSLRLSQVGRCGIEARRIFGTMTAQGTSASTTINQAVADGMLPVVSYKEPNGDVNGVASGAYDNMLDAINNFLGGLGVPVVAVFHHEPNGDMTGQQFQNASARFMSRMTDPDIIVGPILNAFLLDNQVSTWESFTNPTLMSQWEFLGADSYNSQTDERVVKMEQWAADQGHPNMPLMIGEYNAQTAQDLTDAGNAMLASPNMWVFMIWNSTGTGNANATPLEGDRLAAFQATKADQRVLHEDGC